MSNYILRVRSELDTATGKYGWVFDPVLEVAQGLGLTWVKGRVPLPLGGWIEASWNITNGKVTYDVDVQGAKGVKVNVKVAKTV